MRANCDRWNGKRGDGSDCARSYLRLPRLNEMLEHTHAYNFTVVCFNSYERRSAPARVTIRVKPAIVELSVMTMERCKRYIRRQPREAHEGPVRVASRFSKGGISLSLSQPQVARGEAVPRPTRRSLLGSMRRR